METIICSNCVMDTTDTSIKFDDKGVCDHCRNFYSKIFPNWHKGVDGRRILNSKIEEIKRDGKGRDYDCIVGISGGVDSSYLTYLCKEEYGLRPLVFHVDAGWNSQLAVNNIEVLLDKLGLDLFTVVVDWEEMRDLQLSFFKSGVPHIDTPQDHAFFASMYKFANEYGVRHILTGGNLSTECIRNPVDWMYYQSDSIQLMDIHRKFGTIPLNKFPITNILWHKIYLRYFKGIRIFRPLDFGNYVKEDASKFLVDKFGWEPYPRKHFESRFTRFYESFWLIQRFGIDTRKVQFSSLILTGQMTRDEALAELETEPFDENIKEDFEYVATKLGITGKDLENLLNIPKKTYRDYKSWKSVYSIGSFVMKALKMELGGKR